VKRTDRRSDCPINHALQTFGDSWSLLVMRDLMFVGKRTFAEFSESEERISTNVLTSRLRVLSDQGLIRREGRGRATRYSLTAKGLDLLPAMLELIVWSARHDPCTAAPPAFVERAATDRASLLADLRQRLIASHGIDVDART
jgi:DNA-binding HxlR family transcriptional regulator